jgi:hypothetical protein
MDNTYFADGFDDAALGYIERPGQPAVVIYDIQRCLKILVERDGMTPGEAEEYVYYNAVGAWVGYGTPGFLERASAAEIREWLSDG